MGRHRQHAVVGGGQVMLLPQRLEGSVDACMLGVFLLSDALDWMIADTITTTTNIFIENEPNFVATCFLPFHIYVYIVLLLRLAMSLKTSKIFPFWNCLWGGSVLFFLTKTSLYAVILHE